MTISKTQRQLKIEKLTEKETKYVFGKWIKKGPYQIEIFESSCQQVEPAAKTISAEQSDNKKLDTAGCYLVWQLGCSGTRTLSSLSDTHFNLNV